MYEIAIANAQHFLEVDEDFLTRVAKRVLAEEQVAAGELSIALVDDPTIHDINRQYLSHDYPTDVISFLLECEPPEEISAGEKPATLRGRGKKLDGELIISTETAKKEAENFGWSPQDEVVLYLIHGILHLVGYDDLSPTEQSVMRARERAMLALFDISPPQSATSPGETPSSPSSDSEAEPGDEPDRPPSASSPPSRRTES